MARLAAFIDAVSRGDIEVVDLTAPLSADTPIIELPPDFGQTRRFELEEISRYDDRGPAWYWNNFRTGEHTGTHFDAPNHWVTGKDRTTWRPSRSQAHRSGGRPGLLGGAPRMLTSCWRSMTS